MAKESPRTPRKPLARADELVVEDLGGELLVYDQTNASAHCLSAPVVRVWRACDGQTTADALSAKVGLDAGTVTRALTELRECGLLDGDSTVAAGITRRDMGFRAAKVGAAAASLPLIWSITAPLPAAAATPTPEQCRQYNDESCDACREICGCCCCCQAGGIDPSCKLCFPIALCDPRGSFTCPGGADSKCSTTPGADCSQPGTPFNCKKTGLPGPPSGGDPCCIYD